MQDVAKTLPRHMPESSTTDRRALLLRRKIIFALIAALGVTTIAIRLLWTDRPQPETLSYSELVDAVDAGRVASLTIAPRDDIRGRYTGSPSDAGDADFVTIYPVETAEALVDRATGAGVEVEFVPARDPTVYRQLIAFAVQLLLLGALGYLLFLNFRGKGGNGNVGRRGDGSDTSFGDVAGTQGAAEELREVVDFLR